jgi:hypothetical protein
MNGNASGDLRFDGDFVMSDGVVAGSTGNWTIVGGEFTQTGGTFTAQSGDTIFAKNGVNTFSHTTGTFTHNSGRVFFNGVNTLIVGDTTFYDLEYYNASISETMVFTAGSTTTVAGQFSVYGNQSYSNAESSSAGVAATINVTGTSYIYNLVMQDLTFTAAVACRIGCTNTSGNTNIRFGEPGYIITDISGVPTEAGGTATFTVALRAQPTASVVVPVSTGDATEGTVSAATLTFTASDWATPQTVTVTGVEDILDDGGISYSIVLGAPTSSDAEYAALNPPDVSVITSDNDDTAGSMGFDAQGEYTLEDVKDTANPAVGWFEAGNGVLADYGYGNFRVSDGGALSDVEVAGSKIQAGCRVILSGQEYVIHSLDDNAATGYNVTLTIPDKSPVDLAVTIPVDVAVTAIYCSQMTGDGYTLNERVVLTELTNLDIPSTSLSPQISDLLYDTVNDAIWFTEDSDDKIYKINIATGAVTTSLVIGQQSFSWSGQSLAYDSADNAIWAINYTDDTVTKINAATGAYYNGTLGASTFSTGSTEPVSIAYDSDLDRIWIGHEISSIALTSLNSDGTAASTVPLQSGDDVQVLYYDPVEDAIYAAGLFWDTLFIDQRYELIKFDATDGTYFNGTHENSRSILPLNEGFTGMAYDSVRDVFWLTDLAGTLEGALMKVDADTFELLKTYPMEGFCADDAVYDSARDRLLVPNLCDNNINLVNPDTGRVERSYATAEIPQSVLVDADGDVWIAHEDNGPYLSQNVVNGIPFNIYYSSTSTDSAQIDSSTWTGITSLNMTEDDDGQSLFYALSFDDRETFSVYTSGWRDIASSLASVHGGVDGTWYYRDNASVWAAASTSSAERALSQAMAGANNQMTGTELEAISEANWSTAGGFSSSVDTIDFGVIVLTADPRDPPVVDEAAFVFSEVASSSSSGGGSSQSYVTNGDVSIDTNVSCSADLAVTLTLTATHAEDMLISNESDFSGAAWEDFATSKSWTLSAGDGVKTVYAKYRSSTNNLSSSYSDTIILDTTTSCLFTTDEPDSDTPPADDTSTDDPTDTAEDLDAGDFIRTEDDGAVYYITPTGSLRPLPDLQTYLSFTGLCGTFTYVDPSIIGLGPYGPMLLPKANSVLIKFPDAARVYVVADDGLATGVGVLRWVANETAAIVNFGDNWSDYVVTLLPSDNFSYSIGADITGFEADLADDELLARAALNQSITYDVYIINPDGTKRSAFSDWGRVESTADETLVYGIEDKGLDFDYNDVVIDLDPRQCLEIKIGVRPLEAAWHHQIGMTVYYEGLEHSDLILWLDSHAAVGNEITVDLTSLGRSLVN